MVRGHPTQTEPSPTAMASALSPIRMVATTRLKLGSIFDTVPLTALATHTAPSPAAIPLASTPTGVGGPDTRRRLMSTR